MVTQNNAVGRNYREQRGIEGNPAPGLLRPSTSEGDKNRQSLGPARFEGVSVRYVANDDGSPVAEETNALLRELIGAVDALREVMEAR